MGTNGAMLMRDQAISEGDRQLLAQIRISVFGTSEVTATSGGAAPSGGTSVHFILRDGAVRLVGFVPNAEEQNRIVTTVQKVPGVVRVYDALQVGASAAPGQAPASQVPAPGQQTPAQGQTPAPGQPQ
jgi:osmotically-inducible protein OsmY